MASVSKPSPRENVSGMSQWARLEPEIREAIKVVSLVLPFRTNLYVVRELIDWNRVPDDPIFQLTFPQRGMLHPEDYQAIAGLIRAEASPEAVNREAIRIRQSLNPNPAGQMTHNVPMICGEPLPGLQHKYRETVLFFPGQGQTCHAHCTFCFRWPQFVGAEEFKFSNRDQEQLIAYLNVHPEVTNVLITGGDPMTMSTEALRRYIEPLLDPAFDHIHTIRIGTKAVAYWPQRFVLDSDADDLMRLFEQVADAGRHLAIMGHYSHPVELSTDLAQEAVRRIRSAGAQIRVQSPLVRHINDDPALWVELWRTGVRLGAIPYYMFVERDTGAQHYFEVPLVRVWEIFREAYGQVSGIARTVRGPCMSAFPGKIHIVGVASSGGQQVFVLEYLQARDPSLVRRPFFARFDQEATWFNQLEPATDEDREFFPPPDCYDWENSPPWERDALVLASEE